jgi:hypothetical protein
VKSLEAAVLELVVHATANKFDPRELKVPMEDFQRCFEHKGKRYRATLTRMSLSSEKAYFWLLSVSYDPNTALPTVEEGAEIAFAFFRNDGKALPAELDILKWSRKYYITEEVEKR